MGGFIWGALVLGRVPTGGTKAWFCMYWLTCWGMTPIFSISLIISISIDLKISVKSGLVTITKLLEFYRCQWPPSWCPLPPACTSQRPCHWEREQESLGRAASSPVSSPIHWKEIWSNLLSTWGGPPGSWGSPWHFRDLPSAELEWTPSLLTAVLTGCGGCCWQVHAPSG